MARKRSIVPQNMLYQMGYLDGQYDLNVHYRQEIAPLQMSMDLTAIGFFAVVNRLHEAANLATGKKLERRLEILGPELSKAANIYVNAIRAYLKSQGHSHSPVVDGVMEVTAAYQDAIAEVLSGTDKGERLRQIHQGDPRTLYQAFDAGLNVGGRPPGMTSYREYIARRILELKRDYPKHSLQRLGIILKNELDDRIKQFKLTDTEIRAYEVLSEWGTGKKMGRNIQKAVDAYQAEYK